MLTLQQASERSGWSLRSLKQMIYDKRLLATKFGRDWAIKPTDLDKLPAKSKRGRPRRQQI